jgi:hypothetical protein
MWIAFVAVGQLRSRLIPALVHGLSLAARWSMMLKRTLSLVLISSIMVIIGSRPALAAEPNVKEAAFTEKVKAAIVKVGIGPSAKVEITLRDKSKLKGYIQEVNEDHFVLVRDKTGAATEIAYPRVRKVKGNNLSTGAKVAIGFGIGIAILLIVLKDHIMAY